ncbi:MAG: hypothetical protein JSW64_09680 [Candidatus Zixiibacteriota bacterium]|nr:MAG: hypothetical protein JSW64_09680 [candidate division Zixibacteria bacterium]
MVILKKIFIAVIICAIMPGYVSGANLVYLNSYVVTDEQVDNYAFKIDLESKQIADSISLNIDGEFISRYPLTLFRHNSPFLISILTNGLAGKNSILKGHIDSYYTVINGINLNIVFQDSLPDRQLSDISIVSGDSIAIEWLGNLNGIGGWFKSKYIIDFSNGRLINISNRIFREEDYTSLTIGQYYAPKFIKADSTHKFYWGYRNINDSSYVNLIKVNHDDNIVNEFTLGERTIANIGIGYSQFADRIYAIITPFKLLSLYPPIASPNGIIPRIDVIDPVDFHIIQSITIDMYDIYLGHETGSAAQIGPFIYYYYFEADGYGCFDPAYLFIFDTRTNEATWLRVGWR